MLSRPVLVLSRFVSTSQLHGFQIPHESAVSPFCSMTCESRLLSAFVPDRRFPGKMTARPSNSRTLQSTDYNTKILSQFVAMRAVGMELKYR